MNILVLGGNGYLGSKVVKQLIENQNTVFCTKRQNSSMERVEQIRDLVHWIPASIDAIEAISNFIMFDLVINMACNYGRENVLYENVLESNVEFPLKVLNTVVGKGTKKFITIGTGLPDSLNMYSFSKKMFSEFGKFYVEKHNVDFLCLQLEMFYGADEPKDRFIPSVIYKMLKGETVETTIGTQKRDIISIDDIVIAIDYAISTNIHGYYEIPVGTGIAPSISEIIDYIWEETGRKSCVLKGKIPMRVDEPDCVADIGIIKTLGEWNPICWKKGIKKMIEFMEEKYEITD